MLTWNAFIAIFLILYQYRSEQLLLYATGNLQIVVLMKPMWIIPVAQLLDKLLEVGNVESNVEAELASRFTLLLEIFYNLVNSWCSKTSDV